MHMCGELSERTVPYVWCVIKFVFFTMLLLLSSLLSSTSISSEQQTLLVDLEKQHTHPQICKKKTLLISWLWRFFEGLSPSFTTLLLLFSTNHSPVFATVYPCMNSCDFLSILRYQQEETFDSLSLSHTFSSIMFTFDFHSEIIASKTKNPNKNKKEERKTTEQCKVWTWESWV